MRDPSGNTLLHTCVKHNLRDMYAHITETATVSIKMALRKQLSEHRYLLKQGARKPSSDKKGLSVEPMMYEMYDGNGAVVHTAYPKPARHEESDGKYRTRNDYQIPVIGENESELR
jgi:hypothetical protein